MILNNAVNAGNFIYCMFHLGANETHTYFNDGHGHFHQCVYVAAGSGVGTVTDKAGNVITSKPTVSPGELDETIKLTKGTFHTLKTASEGLTLMMFNPIPDSRNLKVDIVKGPTTRTVTADASRTTIVCITGPITANDKTLVSLQHAKVFSGKTAELVVPENSVCALVTE
jgi:hypothetical protein